MYVYIEEEMTVFCNDSSVVYSYHTQRYLELHTVGLAP